MFGLGVSIFTAFCFAACSITVLLSPLLGAGLFGVCGYYGLFEYVWLDIVIVLAGIILGIIVAVRVVRRVGTRTFDGHEDGEQLASADASGMY